MRELLARLNDWWHSFTTKQTPPPPPKPASRGPAAPDMLAPPPMVGQDTLRDWMVHHHREQPRFVEGLPKDANVWELFTADFLDVVFDDPEVKPWFKGVDKARQRVHFMRPLVVMMHIGLTARAANTLKEQHAHLGITGAVFDRVIQLMVNTLTDYGVPRTAILQLAAPNGIVEVLRRRLVTVS